MSRKKCQSPAHYGSQRDAFWNIPRRDRRGKREDRGSKLTRRGSNSNEHRGPFRSRREIGIYKAGHVDGEHKVRHRPPQALESYAADEHGQARGRRLVLEERATEHAEHQEGVDRQDPRGQGFRYGQLLAVKNDMILEDGDQHDDPGVDPVKHLDGLQQPAPRDRDGVEVDAV